MQVINGSGNGMNTVTLSNTGMALKGGTAVEITNGPGPANIVRLSDVGVELKGGTVDILGGSRVTLGCPGGKPAARIGDAVYASPASGVGAISAGSSKVLICN